MHESGRSQVTPLTQCIQSINQLRRGTHWCVVGWRGSIHASRRVVRCLALTLATQTQQPNPHTRASATGPRATRRASTHLPDPPGLSNQGFGRPHHISGLISSSQLPRCRWAGEQSPSVAEPPDAHGYGHLGLTPTPPKAPKWGIERPWSAAVLGYSGLVGAESAAWRPKNPPPHATPVRAAHCGADACLIPGYGQHKPDHLAGPVLGVKRRPNPC